MRLEAGELIEAVRDGESGGQKPLQKQKSAESLPLWPIRAPSPVHPLAGHREGEVSFCVSCQGSQ